MKKFFITVLPLLFVLVSFAGPAIRIDEKVQQSFKATFPNAQKVSWQEYPDAYEVYFVDGSVQTRILYAKDNSYTNYIRYYKDSVLPYPVQAILQKEYPGKKIFGVTETSTFSKTAYLVTYYHVVLEDLKKRYHVTVDNNGLVSLDGIYRKR